MQFWGIEFEDRWNPKLPVRSVETMNALSRNVSPELLDVKGAPEPLRQRSASDTPGGSPTLEKTRKSPSTGDLDETVIFDRTTPERPRRNETCEGESVDKAESMSDEEEEKEEEKEAEKEVKTPTRKLARVSTIFWCNMHKPHKTLKSRLGSLLQ